MVAAAAAAATASDGEQAGPELQRLVATARILMAQAKDASPAPSDYSDASSDDAFYVGEDTDSASAPLSVLPDIEAISVDSLATAVGILRQQGDDFGALAACSVSQRLLDLLLLLERRPGGPLDGAVASAATQDPLSTVQAAAAIVAEGFWQQQDEWEDVRLAVMGMAVDTSLDLDGSDSEEEVAARLLESGSLLPQRLPKLHGDRAVRLASFLAEARAATQLQGAATEMDKEGAAATDTAAASMTRAVQEGLAAAQAGQQASEGEADAEWWNSVRQAYQRLWDQAQQQGVMAPLASQ